ncbi:MAG TPA: carbohydrate kinase family protein [Candidatus Pacearchaeota archaeon]|nr:carbohydrate kinase family protein [Defluviitoga tunisiensis]HPZ74956.1 carbohydrate kinase family protein [Candidatus Pacearchaeota archaeon]
MKIAVIGAVAVDIYTLLDKFPERDSMVFAKGRRSFLGGSGANVAINLSLNNEVDFYFGTGNDSISSYILKKLSKISNLNRIYTLENGPGALTLVMLDSDAERRIISFGGAALFSGDLEDTEYDALCIVESYDKIMLEAFKRFKAPLKVYMPGSFGLYYHKLEGIVNLSESVDFVILSESEAATLKEGLKKITTNKIITRGAKDTVFIDKNGKTHHFEVPKVTSKILDTTGAGDAFCAGFIEGYLNTQQVSKAIESAHEYASRIITRLGPNLVEAKEV